MSETAVGPLKITSSPHVRTHESVARIMWTVNAVLAPVGLFAIYWFGWRAAWTIGLCVGAAMLTEYLIQRFRKVAVTHMDGSAVLTGLLFAYVMPAGQPWFVSVVGSAFAIGIAKHAFGGLFGNNIWNPALVARAFVLAAWPAFTILGASWPRPGEEATPVAFNLNDYLTVAAVEAPAEGVGPVTVTAPTPLTDSEVALTEAEAQLPAEERTKLIRERWQKQVDLNLRLSTGLPEDAPAGSAYLQLLLGRRNGCLGEATGLLLIIGGLFLIFRGYVNWRVPFFFLLSAVVLGVVLPEKIRLSDGTTAFSGFLSGDPLRHLLGGGLLIGAFFMATDMVTSPVSNRGAIIFALGCGILTALIRLFGGYPEGVSYSIILMNTAVPLIDRHTRPRTYGEVKE